MDVVMSPASRGERKRRLSSLDDMQMDVLPSKRHETLAPHVNGGALFAEPSPWAAAPPPAPPTFAPPVSPSQPPAPPPLGLQRTSSRGIDNPLVTLEPAPDSLVLYKPRSTSLESLLDSLSPALKRGKDGLMVLDGAMLARIARRLTPEQQERLAGTWGFVVDTYLHRHSLEPPAPLALPAPSCTVEDVTDAGDATGDGVRLPHSASTAPGVTVVEAEDEDDAGGGAQGGCGASQAAPPELNGLRGLGLPPGAPLPQQQQAMEGVEEGAAAGEAPMDIE